jgi:hypothetical protein
MMGLEARDIMSLSNEELDIYIGEMLGHYDFGRDAADSRNLSRYLYHGGDLGNMKQDSSVPAVNLRNRNQEVEDYLKKSRPNVTVPPEITATKTKHPQPRREKPRMSILKAVYLKKKTQETDPDLDSDYDDYRHSYYRNSYYRDYYDREDDDSPEDWWPEDLDFDDNLTKTLTWLRPIFTIKSITPKSMRHFQSKLVTLEISPNLTETGMLFCFCKFDGVIVKGQVDSSGFGLCRAPAHDPGNIAVFFSTNNESWVGPIEFLYEGAAGWESLILVAPTAVVFMAICGLLVCVINCMTEKGVGKGRVPSQARRINLPRRGRRP